MHKPVGIPISSGIIGNIKKHIVSHNRSLDPDSISMLFFANKLQTEVVREIYTGITRVVELDLKNEFVDK